jgi:ribosome-associated protein
VTDPSETPPSATPPSDAFDTEALAEAIVDAAWDRKARNVVVIDVRGIASYTDFLVIANGTSERHAQAIADNVADELRPFGIHARGFEGRSRGDWVLLDLNDAVLHVFGTLELRQQYALESLYGDAPRLTLESPAELEDDAETLRGAIDARAPRSEEH